MKEIPLTKGKVAFVDDEDFEYLNQFKWQLLSGRAVRFVIINRKKRLIMMHRDLLQLKDPKVKIDHINHNQLDNRKLNLRCCNQQQNMLNVSSHSDSSSKYLGVHFQKQTKKWRAMIKVNGKSKHIGLFNEELEAAKAYNKMAIAIHGEFANLNKF